jgi:biopolymer transport protein TolR
MLVLLIIFMITAPMLQQGITVNLPEVEAAPLDPSTLEDNEPLILGVDAEGRLFLNLGEAPDEPKSPEDVIRIAEAVLSRNPETPVLVKGDEAVGYGRVMYGMSLLKQAGARQIGMMTDTPAPEDE